ncbi:metallophosphoesterase [Paenisporosarcina sp. TG20]|uniref:metallophosphoesterase n=1 Tax=Paenisporosarcina sp. TG20 TaxID=1211706 RepID=UPI000380C0AA|nr:metallophosphoesterase [Paenisporosarcina sp. TG20]
MIKKALKIIVISSSIFLGVLVIWGLIEPYYINVEKEEASIPNLPESWKGEEIAVVGDFQVGMWMDNSYTVERVVNQLVEMEPKAVLITGDFIYHTKGDTDHEIEKVQDLLRPLAESSIPVFTVLGNHDYEMDKKTKEPNLVVAEKLTSSLEDIGITVMENESVPLTLSEDEVEVGTPSNNSLFLVGIGSTWPGFSSPTIAFDDVPEEAPRVVLAHNPKEFESFIANSAPLTISGHTHGGQIRIPITPDWSYLSMVKDGKTHPYGWFDQNGTEGNHLYVNPGIGFSALPLRINVPPEITLFTLK